MSELKEEWCWIENFEGLYQASNTGKIRSWKNLNGKGLKDNNPHLMKGKSDKDGYIEVCLSKNRKKKYVRKHRIIAQTFIPNPQNKPCINHKDGDKTNNHVDNLEWVTHSENTKHAYKNDLMKGFSKGENHPNSKLSKKDVMEIRILYENEDKNIKEITKNYNVSRTAISNIVNYKNWVDI